ncbi:hypothetical protein NEOLEDRAFT_1175903 [Neolentinus lepideus HHB14362 ss-1]|uniref:G-patch domain-containing protein n=1 Tax=Neolentinus lepideus HHB14362 ss-1 TaxID=1314782 RepID=A0A165URZ4_9AGAM|nr:hypothetical protein NEOLEDRAFT_1175903 [Neolentinus lepideus HHB14362 ss-1]
MAYNREWDRGKDQWGDSGAWNDNNGRGNIRGRDEDYHGEGKRRKYNDGGYANPSRSHDEGGYDNSWGQSEEYHEDRQKGHTRKRLMPSEASPHVIFLGLDPDFTEADLQAYLANQGFTVESVTIIRERSTGTCPFGFGFAQFATVEHARAFVGPSFPFIQVPPPASHGASATAAFYKALQSGAPHTGRRVKIDYSQSANPADKGRRGPMQSNDGTRDIGNTQSPLLLFRGLDPLSGPQAISIAMKSSSGPGKEGAKGMKRIILIKDRVTLASWGFAFVEFVDVQSASAVLAATMSPQLHPNGFRMSDKPVAASFAHPYSFQPVDPMRRDEAAIASTSVLGGSEGGWVRYWDEASTVAVLDFKVEEPPKPATITEKKKEKKKAKDADTSNASASTVEASVLPVSDKPVTLSFNKTGISINKGTSGSGAKAPAPIALAFSMTEDRPDEAEDAAAQAAASQDLKVTATKKVAPMIASKKTANNISKWNQVQEELNPSAVAASSSTATSAPDADAVPVVEIAKAKSVTPAPAEGEFEFADMTKMACLLCARQFKTLDQLKRHNKESDLHKKNYKDASLRETARGKAAAAKHAAAGSPSTPSEPKYRDRAAERRIMHNQPEAPLPENMNSSHSKKTRYAEGPPPPPKAVTPPAAPLNLGQDQNNVGNKLLKMMGWTEGTGLGVDGEGRVEPIQTALYEQGVGLGASKGKDITHLTEGYTGYVNAAKDAARERYGS